MFVAAGSCSSPREGERIAFVPVDAEDEPARCAMRCRLGVPCDARLGTLPDAWTGALRDARVGAPPDVPPDAVGFGIG